MKQRKIDIVHVVIYGPINIILNLIIFNKSQQHQQANVIKFINYLADIQLKKIIKPLDHDSNMEIINDHYADSIRLS